MSTLAPCDDSADASAGRRRPPRTAQSFAAEAAFRARLEELGATLLESAWLGLHAKHRIKCAAGHEGATRPSSARRRKGVCRTCAGLDPAVSEAAFRARVKELGGVVLEPKWLGTHKPHQVICAAGHECAPHPGGVRDGQGLCRTCAGQDPAATEATFRARVEKLGGTVLEPEWLGAGTPHRAVCAAGHECTIRPDGLRRRDGICRMCPGARAVAAWDAFCARVEELGGVVLEPAWLGVDTPHRIRCREGHYSNPRPTVTKTGGICRACAGKDPATAEAAFRARLTELGAVLLEPKWLGSQKPHRIRCAAGHERTSSPHQAKRGGVCLTCAGKDPDVAEAKFRTRVAELGGTLLEPKWLGNNRPHRVRCAAGHEVAPHPGGVQRGQGICRICAGQVWDAFYVVADEINDHLKFGITSGDPRPRLAKHERNGFDTVLRLTTSLPGDVAPELERQILAALRDAGERPVKGREYFPLRVQALVLDLVDNHPAIGGAT